MCHTVALPSGSSWCNRKSSLPQQLSAFMGEWPGKSPGEPGKSPKHFFFFFSCTTLGVYFYCLFVCFVLGMEARALGMLTNAMPLSYTWLGHHHHQISFLWHGLIQSKLSLNSLNSCEWLGTPDLPVSASQVMELQTSCTTKNRESNFGFGFGFDCGPACLFSHPFLHVHPSL